MLIIDGPNDVLRAAVLKEVRKQLGKTVEFQKGEERSTLQQFLKLVHSDHRLVVRERLFMAHLDDSAARHMITMALKACGTYVIACCDEVGGLEFKLQKLACSKDGVLPMAAPFGCYTVPQLVEYALEHWHIHIGLAEQSYRYNSSGDVGPEPRVMVVGENVIPFAPYDQTRRLAFTSTHGSSLFLHQALSLHGGSYYLTNAWKTKNERTNMQLLKEEIKLVKPVKIVAMGGVAQLYLSNIGIEFERTYHPQYWKRFKNQHINELVQILKPNF